MTYVNRRLLFSLLMLLITVSPVHAETAKTLSWEELVPKFSPLEDPYSSLPGDQGILLETLAAIRDSRARGLLDKGSPMDLEGERLTRLLREQQLDVEARLAEVAAWEAELERRGAAVIPELEGQRVRIPGYALPLEFSGTAVTDFLLVPYVGACIHTPPPPPNQIVFVRVNEPYEPAELYEPVWVVGNLTTQGTQKLLSLVDGQAPIDTGYALEGIRIEPYRE